MMTAKNSHYVSRFTIAVALFEFTSIITILALFSYGYPDASRTTLWQEGGLHGFNSDPRKRIYFYANHKEPPPIAFIWSRKFTNLNLSVAVLTFWVFITKVLLYEFGVMNKYANLFFHICLLPFWIISLVVQMSSDMSDDEHLSPVPWYMNHGCGIASDKSIEVACRVAQARYGVSWIMALFYACNIWSQIALAGLECLIRRNADCNSRMDVMWYHAQEVRKYRAGGDVENSVSLLRSWDQDD